MKKQSNTFIKSLLFLIIIVLLVYGTKLFKPSQYQNIRIVGSSTAFPFISNISEVISKRNPEITIIIETTGTGSGFQLFCQKNHVNSHPDIVMASRPITTKELELCKKNGTDPQEIIFGYDAILILSSSKSITNLERDDIFLAISEFTPTHHTLTKNKISYWNEINTSLPKQLIEIYGPPYSSGTRDEMNKLVMNYSCKQSKFSTAYHNQSLCTSVRRDGRYIETGENENLVIQKLKSNPLALGILGYNFYVGNQDLNVVSIDNIYPDFHNISTFKYPLTRPLYLYFHKKNQKTLKNFMLELTKNEFFIQNSHLMKIGLIPPKPEQVENLNKTILNLVK
ncbi:MAG: substrate-binding domain-containing protein [Rickettsiales bacterium]|nr:substrate-binding domain-containing protein [Rickettsiales bacterium]